MISPGSSSPLSHRSIVAGVIIAAVRIPPAPGNRRRPNHIDVQLSQNEAKAFYDRSSNQLLYSALHGLTGKPILNGDWDTYRAVNQRYADAILRELRAGDLVWVHDYHLMLVPRLVRARYPCARMNFFFHVPFASAEKFMRIPAASSLIDGVLGADGIEFESSESASNFLMAVASTGVYATRATVVEDAGRPVCVFARSGARSTDWRHGFRRAPVTRRAS